jgi:transposase
MLTSTIKLRLNKKQETMLKEWLWNLTSVWNWAIKKIELNANDKIYFSKFDFVNLLADHGKKLGIPSHTIQGILTQAHTAWSRCFQKIGGRPKLKGQRNKLNSVVFPDKINSPKENHISIPGLGKVRYHKQELPKGNIKCGRIIKRATGWYLCLFIDTQREPIIRTGYGKVGIDPGFKSLLTLYTGEKIEHPRELEAIEKRISQAQRGHDKELVSSLYERRANQVKDRNHKLSLRLVKENVLIAFSKDNIKGIAKKFGKSVSSSGHYQLRQMISYKSSTCGTEYKEPESKNSTKTCSACGALTGPSGWSGLSVRQWVCSACGAVLDRDINAAINTLVGAGAAHEEGLQNVA